MKIVQEKTTSIVLPQGVEIHGQLSNSFLDILNFDSLVFVAGLHRKFNETRKKLLEGRILRQQKINGGEFPDFLPETESVRKEDWVVSPLPQDLQNRRVEITGPVDRKMIINALNSPVNVFMADFEDSNSPTWTNTINGQINLRDAVNRTITYENSKTGKYYSLRDNPAVLMVRPRGLHLDEKQVLIDGEPISASLFDFGLYFYHNAQVLIDKGSGPYFYLPKLENHLEARLWNDVFVCSQKKLKIKTGTIKTTVLIETILAAFEMDEILYELRDHSAGLNCGRWDYIFSFIKKFQAHKSFMLPNRSEVTMNRHFMKSYVDLLVQTCHKRNVHAMGGMAAQIPIKNDDKANQIALNSVRLDKEREVKAGHDGTWIAHPGLADIAHSAFNSEMFGDNQINVQRPEVEVTAEDLLRVPSGTITEEGIRHNIRVGIQYISYWLKGNGCVPLYHLMEDAATAEICRSQLWQWIHHGAKINTGEIITSNLFLCILDEEWLHLKNNNLEQAMLLFKEMVLKDAFDEFLTLSAYKILN